MYEEKDIITFGNENYIREGAIQAPIESSSLLESVVGKFVIVRTRNEGINAGIVVAADETGIILSGCRRLHYHKPLDKKLSWYEGVATSGISSDSRLSGVVPKKVIVEDYSITECSETARESIMGAATNEQG